MWKQQVKTVVMVIAILAVVAGCSGKTAHIQGGGVNPNATIDDEMATAAKSGDVSFLKKNIEADKSWVTKKWPDGTTLLIYAARKGQLKAVKYLISAGADVNASNNDGETALSVAEDEGHDDVVDLLKQNGAK